MTISDEDVQAYVDGELAPEHVVRIEAAIADDVLVAARVERAKRLRLQERGAVEGPGQVAQGRVRAVSAHATRRGDRGASTSLPLPETRARASRWRLPAIAMVAVIAALAIGERLRTPRTDMLVRGGALYAGAELAKRLDSTLAAAPAATFAIGLTFRDTDGGICRTFVSMPSRIAGVACRKGDEWALPVVSRLDSAAIGGSQPLANMPADVFAAANARMQGGAFDALRERKARESGWR